MEKRKGTCITVIFFVVFGNMWRDGAKNSFDKVIKITFIYISLVILSLRGILKCFWSLRCYACLHGGVVTVSSIETAAVPFSVFLRRAEAGIKTRMMYLRTPDSALEVCVTHTPSEEFQGAMEKQERDGSIMKGKEDERELGNSLTLPYAEIIAFHFTG